MDYLTYDTKGIWRCYEIKVSKADFHSKAKKTFIGHYNYYVMTSELYEEVKDEVPKHIGVYCSDNLVKRPKKQELKVEEGILKNSLIRSLSREQEKYFKLSNTDIITKLNRKISSLKSENKKLKKEINEDYMDIRLITRNICDKHNLDYKEVKKIIRDEL
ncbi:TPA: hypothetical protein ACXDAZ_002522 [Clostridium botulinum]